MPQAGFDWDPKKDLDNQARHGVSFAEAQYAFADPQRVIAEDPSHSTQEEKRFYCFGSVGGGVLTVRFAYREDRIRIIGAGYWRKGKRIYEQTNQVHGRTTRPHKGRQ
ncbi:MAG: BrnT family toxin [Deltaproteobacteria bacterium]|nr:BrnT family toxin [Deltaproteobacteria bacterium]